MRLRNRVQNLEGNSRYLTIGEMLDSLDDVPIDPGKKPNPAFRVAVEGMD